MAPTDDCRARATRAPRRVRSPRAEQGDEAAAELFLRAVLGDVAYERMARSFQDRSKAKAAQIRADSAALIAYRPRYAELRAFVRRCSSSAASGPRRTFAPTLDALFAALPDARLEMLAGAGHMMHAEAQKRFADVVVAFARDTGMLSR